MLIVRADGNKEIGTGHLMRALSIMEQAESRGHILFLVSDEQGKQIVESKGFSCRVLHTNYKDMEAELPILFQLLAHFEVEKILVDSYQITKHYLEKLSNIAPVMLVEDFITDTYDVRYLLNYNIYADESIYEKMYMEPVERPQFLIDTKYVPLRKQFQDGKCIINDKVTSVLILTGGTDPQNLAKKILDKLQNYEQRTALVFHVVCGVFSEHVEELKRLEREHANVFLHQNITNMAELMIKSDVAISAAGTTTYELAAVGLPTVLYAFVDNQDQCAEAFSRKGMMLYAGDSRMEVEERLEIILSQFEILAKDYQLRKTMHEKMIEQVDGLGSKRIYKILSGESK